jgi:hypothetical protein
MSDDFEPIVEEQPPLFEPEPDPLWRGMPSYQHENLEPWQTIQVHFQTPADRDAFSKLVKQQLHPKTQYIWFPEKIEYVADKAYVSQEPVNPRYPVYVPTKGRWDSALTIKALEELRVPYFAVVQPQEELHYRSVVKTGTILLLPAGLDGLVPARNWRLSTSLADRR